MTIVMQYICPICKQEGAHPTTAKPPKCHNCRYKVVMVPCKNGRPVPTEKTDVKSEPVQEVVDNLNLPPGCTRQMFCQWWNQIGYQEFTVWAANNREEFS